MFLSLRKRTSQEFACRSAATTSKSPVEWMRSGFTPKTSWRSSTTSSVRAPSKNPIWSNCRSMRPLWRPGCQFRGTLEYYLPEFMDVNISRDELAGIYEGLVLPVLLEMFGREREGPVGER